MTAKSFDTAPVLLHFHVQWVLHCDARHHQERSAEEHQRMVSYRDAGDAARAGNHADMSEYHAMDARRSLEALAIHMRTAEYGP